MRIKRTDGNFTVRQKADRKIHYAGQGKKYTESTAKSCIEKQDALRQKNTLSKKPESCPQRAYSPDKNPGIDCLTGTGKQHRQDHEVREPAVSGNLHRKQQTKRPSAYRETSLKIKEPALHRKAEIPSGISNAAGFNTAATQSRKARSARKTKNVPTQDTEKKFPSDGYALSFTEKREGQISCYRKEKYLEARKQEYRAKEAEGAAPREEHQPIANPVSYPATQENTPAGESSHIHKREAGDTANRRSGEIPGRKQQGGNDSRTDKSGKKRKGRDKNSQKDSSHKISGKSRKDRAAAFRLLSYASDKLSGEEQKDSLLKVAKDLLLGKVKAAATGAFLSAASALIPILLPAFIVAVIITLLFNSPFSILLPKLTEEPGAVEVLAVYTEEFREKVQEELEDTGRCDETELIYEDYEGDGEPDNMAGETYKPGRSISLYARWEKVNGEDKENNSSKDNTGSKDHKDVPEDNKDTSGTVSGNTVDSASGKDTAAKTEGNTDAGKETGAVIQTGRTSPVPLLFIPGMCGVLLAALSVYEGKKKEKGCL